MWGHLEEGDIGRVFAEFARTNQELASCIVADAIGAYRPNSLSYDNMGQFAHFYLEWVIALMEPNVGQFPPAYGTPAYNDWLCTILEKWGMACKIIIIGKNLA